MAGVLRPPKGPFWSAWTGVAAGAAAVPRQRLPAGCGSSGQQLPCHLPPPAQPQAPAAGLWAGCRAGGARPTGTGVGGLGGQVALLGPGGCPGGRRQTDGVTPQSPRAWLGATREPGPPVAALSPPPRLVSPHKAASVSARQARPTMESGKKAWGGIRGPGLPTNMAHKVNRCAPTEAGWGRAEAGHQNSGIKSCNVKFF